MRVPIVVAAYNRPPSLKRILRSLDNARYPHPVELIISVDKSETNEVLFAAQQFRWSHGKKTVLANPENLGLRNHIIQCGDLSQHYDAIIMLEDDLYVSPEFYFFALAGLSYYQGHPQIAGISLYSHRYDETSTMKFTPLEDHSDVFFMQIPSSWGQCWYKDGWQEFKQWYDVNSLREIRASDLVPPNVALWPSSSWKKYFFKYMIEMNKLFVYPQRSFSTNFADIGTNHKDSRTSLQIPLSYKKMNLCFIAPEDSKAKYDAYCELMPDSLIKQIPKFGEYDFQMDLYGKKDCSQVRSEFIITSKKCQNPVLTYGRMLKPHEMNIIEGIDGNVFKLVAIQNCESKINTLDKITCGYYYDLRPHYLSIPSYLAADLPRPPIPTQKLLPPPPPKPPPPQPPPKSTQNAERDAFVLSQYYEYKYYKKKFAFRIFMIEQMIEWHIKNFFKKFYAFIRSLI